MLTLVLTRHGSTLRSDPEQHLGQLLDLPLSDLGRSAAIALGGRLAGLRFDRLVTSPLRRSRETAALVVPGADVERDPRLIEMDYGRWEGLTYGEIEAGDAEARRRWEADPAQLHCPGGESGDEVAARVTAFLDDLLAWSAAAPAPVPEDVGGRRVLVVAHSSTNRVLLCVAMGVALRDYRRRFVQEPANLTVLGFDPGQGPGARLLVANDVSHLRGIRGDTWG
ncbi:MAG: histidine phosphatase family protein [Candidatus Limnocylindrales bacterium]|jgi:broad specificity phosphatase PhoE